MSFSKNFLEVCKSTLDYINIDDIESIVDILVEIRFRNTSISFPIVIIGT